MDNRTHWPISDPAALVIKEGGEDSGNKRVSLLRLMSNLGVEMESDSALSDSGYADSSLRTIHSIQPGQFNDTVGPQGRRTRRACRWSIVGSTKGQRTRRTRRRVFVRRCLKVIAASAALVVLSCLLFFLSAGEDALPGWARDTVERMKGVSSTRFLSRAGGNETLLS